MAKPALELRGILILAKRPFCGEFDEAAQLLLQRESGRTDALEIGHIGLIATSTRILDQDLGDADDRGDRCAKFLSYEGCNDTLKALVWISHVASRPGSALFQERASKALIFPSRRGISIGLVS